MGLRAIFCQTRDNTALIQTKPVGPFSARSRFSDGLTSGALAHELTLTVPVSSQIGAVGSQGTCETQPDSFRWLDTIGIWHVTKNEFVGACMAWHAANKTTVTITMERRKFLIGAGSLAAGGAAALGSGAFTSVEAQREIELAIQPDGEGAYLDFGNTSQYANKSGGTLSLTFDEQANTSGGKGISSQANSTFEGVFSVYNNGTQEVSINIPTGSDPENSPGVASTQFLVAEGDSLSDDPYGYKYGTGPVEVDSVDISWPGETIPENKPSNPVPETGTEGNVSGTRVRTEYQGLRYPGGQAVVGVGQSVSVDVRFTVSNPREQENDFGTEPFIIEAEATNQSQ